MRALSTTRPRDRVLTTLAGAATMASMLAAAGCVRTSAQARAPVPASAIGRLTAMAHRVARFRFAGAFEQIAARVGPHRLEGRGGDPRRCFQDYKPMMHHVRL